MVLCFTFIYSEREGILVKGLEDPEEWGPLLLSVEPEVQFIHFKPLFKRGGSTSAVISIN